jgi:signal transduction histidine kinase
VTTRLYAILLIPVLVALVLGGLRVHGSYDRWQEAEDAERTAELVRAATTYAHALVDERDVTAGPLLTGRRDDPAVLRAREATDRAREAFHAAAGRAPADEGLQRRIEAVTRAEPHLDGLRQDAYTDELPGAETELGYVEIQHPLMALTNELGHSGTMASYGRAVYAVSLAKAASSLQRSLGTHLLLAPGPDEAALRAQTTTFASYHALEAIAREEFAYAAGTADGRELDAALVDAGDRARAEHPSAPRLGEMADMLAAGASPVDLTEEGVTPAAWYTAATAAFDAYRGLETRLVDSAVAEAGDTAAAARRDMIVNGVLVLAAVLLAVVLAALMARTMSRTMRVLRTAALAVAEQRLPAVVAQLSRTRPGDVDTSVAPIDVRTRDELGEIARAFDLVHAEAVRLAADQALLRGNVNAIFTGLSARNQGLIERQLALISELESREADPAQLEQLFKLDHLATRMRRNGENLLVLAGEEPQNRWNQPVALVDVMRAAVSEVEAYARIEVTGVPPTVVDGPVVGDLVHLLAELLENATTFSSPQTRVRVTATRLPDGRVMIEIHDKGIGLAQEDFAEINRRLSDPPAVDADVSRRMGLFVVARLARRHGIRVQLRPSAEGSGTTSLVMLPEAVNRLGPPVPPGAAPQYTVSRVAPEAAPALGERAAPRQQRGGRHAAPAVAGAPSGGAPADQGRTGPAQGRHRVGFSPADQVARDPRAATGAGLPRRESTPQHPREEPAQRPREEPAAPAAPGEPRREGGPRREERTGGVTPSGLPRRVPRANLAGHSLPEPEPGGPQVSRDPDDVRGRLSSLRRGVQQGRGAGGRPGTQNDERGTGPGHTYDQER